MCKFIFISSFVVVSVFVHLSHGQSETWNDQVIDLTKQIDENPSNADLYLQRSKLRVHLSESERRETNFSAWDFPVSRAGIETLELALSDASEALNLDPKLADAYFQRAEIQIRHPDVGDFVMFKLVFPILSQSKLPLQQENAYQKYGESENPKIVAEIIKKQVLADLQAGLKLQPESTVGLSMRWMSLRSIGENELAISEINETLQQPGISNETRIMSLRHRVNLMQSQNDGGQANADEAEIRKYEQLIRDEEEKIWAEGQVVRLSEQLKDVGLDPLKRASILSQRAGMYQKLEMEVKAREDRAEYRSIHEDYARKKITELTTRLSADDLPVQERIRLLTTRARNYQYLGQTENFQSDELEAAKLECEPRITSLTKEINEDPKNPRLKESLLRMRAGLYKRIGQEDLAEADLALANKIKNARK